MTARTATNATAARNAVPAMTAMTVGDCKDYTNRVGVNKYVE